MQTLLLMRHAKSSWRESGTLDHDRPLNERGVRAAPYMGRVLAAAGLVPELVITSSATRALETAKAVSTALGFTGPLEVTSRLYLAEPAVYLDVLEDLPTEPRIVLLVGHNPGVSELLEQLTGVSEDMATASIAELRLPEGELQGLRAGRKAQLVKYWKPPKDLKDL